MEPVQIGQLLQENQKSALQQTGKKPLRSFELEELSVAIESPLVSTCSIEELKQVLRLVMVKVGLRGQNWPGEMEKAVLLDHVLKNFGGHKVEEIKLAFEMAIAGKLEIEDINCYENFSCAYFSKIMNGYRLWSAQAIKQLQVEEPPAQIIYTDAQLDDQQREDIEHFYQRLLKGQIPYRIPEYFKGMLVKDGLMRQDEYIENFLSHRLNNGIQNIYKKVE